jgi:predicted nucleic acid-binding protein
VIYLDASAMVTYVLKRANVWALRAHLRNHAAVDLVTSTVGLIETVRSCDRVGTFPNLMGQLLGDYTEFQLTPEIRDMAAGLPGRLKALDAIHVATAETLGDELISFVTYDRTTARLARSRGLPVVSPGANL